MKVVDVSAGWSSLRQMGFRESCSFPSTRGLHRQFRSLERYSREDKAQNYHEGDYAQHDDRGLRVIALVSVWYARLGKTLSSFHKALFHLEGRFRRMSFGGLFLCFHTLFYFLCSFSFSLKFFLCSHYNFSFPPLIGGCL